MKKSKDETSTQTKEERFLNQLKNEILSYFDINYEQTFSLNQLHKAFAVKDRSMKFIYQGLVDELATEGKLLRLPDGTYQIDNGLRYRVGRIEHANARFAFLVSEEAEHDGDDVWIAAEDLNGALDGDRVKVAVFKGSKRSGRRAEGQVEEILERKRTELVGTLDSKGVRFAIVIPDSRRIYHDFAVPLDALNGANPGEKVIIDITQFPAEGVRAEGRVREVLGKAGDNNTEMHAILAEFGLPYHFPETLEAAAAQISEVITEEEVAKRRDFRGVTTFTIDPRRCQGF
jgi:ribonuclease R